MGVEFSTYALPFYTQKSVRRKALETCFKMFAFFKTLSIILENLVILSLTTLRNKVSPKRSKFVSSAITCILVRTNEVLRLAY